MEVRKELLGLDPFSESVPCPRIWIGTTRHSAILAAISTGAPHQYTDSRASDPLASSLSRQETIGIALLICSFSRLAPYKSLRILIARQNLLCTLSDGISPPTKTCLVQCLSSQLWLSVSYSTCFWLCATYFWVARASLILLSITERVNHLLCPRYIIAVKLLQELASRFKS